MEEKGKKRGGGKSTRRGREEDATVVVSTSSVAFLFQEKFLLFIFSLFFLSGVFLSLFLENRRRIEHSKKSRSISSSKL
jgi:hypothetical protein